jgi:transmembrane sensor
LKVADRDASNVRISGVFHAGDTEAFIDGVTALFPVRAERDARGATFVFEGKKPR